MKTITVNTRSFGRYVGYLSNGLNVDESEIIIKKILGQGSWTIEKWFVEPNPKRRFYKPELEKALEYCAKRGCKLILPKVSHLVNNLVFVDLCYQAQVKAKLENKTFEILGCDLMGSENLQMGLLYSLAMAKSEKTSKSVKAKMKELKAQAKATATLREQAKDRRTEVLPIIKKIKQDGNHTYQEIANQLNKRNVPTARGGVWHATSVRNIIKRGNK